MTIEKLTEEDLFLLVHGCAGTAQGEKAIRIIDELTESWKAEKARANAAEERVARASEALVRGGSMGGRVSRALEALRAP